MAIVRSMGPGSGASGGPNSSVPSGQMPQIIRPNMNPQRVGGPQTIVVGRTGQVSGNNMVTMGRQNMINNSMVLNTPGIGGIRVQGPGIGTRINSNTVQVQQGQNIVINQPGLRPGQAGSQITVPLQTLQSLRPGQGIPTGQNGLLVKTESGQYQILRVGSTLPNSSGTTNTVVTSGSGSGMSSHSMTNPLPIRPTSMSQSISTSNVSLAQRPMITSVPTTPTNTTTRPTMNHHQQQQQQPSQAANAALGGAGAGSMGSQMTPDTAKLKCKNFLATLLRLAGEQPAVVATNVRNLIQGLIDGIVEPEVFTTKLQKELNSSPQPCLVPFLKKSLPYLQQSLINGDLSVEGVRPPAINSPAGRLLNKQPVQGLQQHQQQQQQPQQVKVVMSTPGVQLPQRPNMLMQTVRTMSQPVRTQSSLPMNSGAVVTGISNLRPTNQAPANIRAISTPLPKSIVPTARIGYGTIQHPPQPQSIPISTISSMPTMNTVPKISTFSSSVFSSTTTSSTLGPPAVMSKPDRKLAGSSYSSAGDEDINDVATMGGVNLAEESQRMQGATDLMIGTQIRSCKDETFLQTGLLHHKISKICREKGLDDASMDVVALISHATQERLKSLLEKLDVIAEHRLDIVKTEGDYEVTQDVRGQIKFLGDLDKIERKRHDEAERELLLKAAKSRTKTEDPEKEKLKAKAKELQRMEEEQLRHEKANNTALLAIGMPKKKLRLDDGSMGTSGIPNFSSLGSKSTTLSSRPRTKRVNLRDLLFLMEQEKSLKRSPLMWKAYSS